MDGVGPDIVIESLRGGLNDTDPVSLLAPDECTIADNVEFFYSTLGERRAGCNPFDVTGSGLETQAQGVHVSQWFPGNQVTNPEIWGIASTFNVSSKVARNTGSIWHAATPNDAIVTTVPDIYNIVSQSLNGKLFWAYHSAVDRLHLWDGTAWIRAGLAQPSPPTAANEAATVYASTRYFRVRFTVQNTIGVTTQRTVVGSVLTFVPAGTSQGALIAMPPQINQGETHWELEASVDNITFYLLAAQAVSTLTFFDTTVFGTGYSGGAASAAAVGSQLTTTPAAPTAIDSGYAGIRYFRVRYVTLDSASKILRRSEPSTTLIFTPSGTAKGATITRPALLSESETHWEVEASTDNANFYRIATVIDGTTTYNDEIAFAVGYAASGTLSEDIGTYALIPSAKFLAVDGDRLLFAGHWTDATRMSRVGWTPVFNDPGVGNDERLPAQFNDTLDLDNYEGGPITGISNGSNGTWYVFKWSHIYKMTRTGDSTRAYDVITVSKIRGAIPGSVFAGADERGASCIYFIDPLLGPSRLVGGGLQLIRGLRNTVKRINLFASTIIARGVYYPFKHQAHWWVAVDGADTPTLKLVLQVTELRPKGGEEIGGGWSTATGLMAQATTVAIFNEWVNDNGAITLSERPFIGLPTPSFIQRCDVATTDAGVAYRAHIRTGPRMIAGIMNRWGAIAGTLLASAYAGANLVVSLVRDFGAEQSVPITTGLAAVGSEDPVLHDFDNIVMAESRSVQVDFIDP